MPESEATSTCRFERPLRIAALVKQIPVGEAMALGDDRRLVRSGLPLEMNAYCRRAVAKGVEWAQLSGGTCTVITLGPATAEDVLREAIAWGADDGVHVCDAAFAGSDTLATARAIAATIRRLGDFDLVLVGRNSLDGDTGQVGPELAELIDLPFASGVFAMGLGGEHLSLELQHDDGWEEVTITLPAVLSVAERLCEPCKMPPDARAAVDADRISRITAADLGGGPWGEAGSPTRVGRTRTLHHARSAKVLRGTMAEQVAECVSLLEERGALQAEAEERTHVEAPRTPRHPDDSSKVIGVVVESGRPNVAAELMGAASSLADLIGGHVHAVSFDAGLSSGLGRLGADEVTIVDGTLGGDAAAGVLLEWCAVHSVWAVLGPSTDFGREVLGRAAAGLGSGLVGDAVELTVVDGELCALKPAFSGSLVADITYTSTPQLVTVRPGVLAVPAERSGTPVFHEWFGTPRSRVQSTFGGATTISRSSPEPRR